MHIAVWPDVAMTPIEQVEVIHCRFNEECIAGLLMMASPKEVRVYGRFDADLSELFNILAHNLRRLKTVFLYDVTTPHFYRHGNAIAFYVFVGNLVAQNRPITVVFNSDEFHDAEMDFDDYRVNIFCSYFGNGNRRAWQKVFYNSRYCVYLRDVRGTHVFAAEDVWF